MPLRDGTGPTHRARHRLRLGRGACAAGQGETPVPQSERAAFLERLDVLKEAVASLEKEITAMKREAGRG